MAEILSFKPSPIRIPGFKCLIQGDAGTGKTHSIGTLIDTGLHVCYIAMGNEIESIFGYYADKGRAVPKNFSYQIIQPPEASFSELISAAEKVSQYSYEMLTKMIDTDRKKYNHHINLLTALNDFVDQRAGEHLGPVNKWSTDRVLVIDPMTGINRAAMDMVVGGKPVRSPSEWGIAQDQVERLLRALTSDCECHFVLLAHVEKELDPIQGGMRTTISTLGKALAPKIPPMFSDVAYSYRDGRNWWWSTENSAVVTKIRNLPISDKIPQDFKQIVEKWTKRKEAGIKI